MKVKAYGKINLTLDVVGRREDGYHLLDTVMQAVSIWDELEILPAKGREIKLECNKEEMPLDSKNTVYRAAEFFLEEQGLKDEGLYINIHKYIPSRSGMGGGSADAAAVLRALNVMYETGLNSGQLMKIGAKVGADVPFCVTGGAARCTGTGTEVVPAPMMPDCWLVLCKPPAGMSTPRAYSLLDQYPLSGTRATPEMLDALAAGDLRRIARGLANRFDETIRIPQVRAAKQAMMEAGALGAMMTGSGSGVYGIFETEQAARAAAGRLESEGQTFVMRPCKGV